MANVLPVFENWLRATVRDEMEKSLEADRAKAKPEKMLTRREVCNLLGISLPTLWKRVKNKELTPVHIGRRVVFKESEIKKFVEG